MLRPVLFTVFAACLLLPAPLPAAPADAALISGRAAVVDGDTLRIGAVTIRIHGIDAPEQGQRCDRVGGGTWDCGEAATAQLAAMAGGKALECTPVERDAYGRIVARCHAAGRDLGEDLVAQGLAWAFTRYSADYAATEAAARARQAGIWQAETMPAWDYRKEHWAQAVAERDSRTCPIKGNISSKGERIYHTPWSPAYARTRVDESRGERWFCDEAEALAAGWRAARWR
ncbi:thermonuclease family protein [Paracoccus sp. (in: a-proteobacteria)]|uniref:thermonuclease family protein n=1 Tax=Paracoccus sp. TaxID=267 RepID=UPI00321FC0E9